MANRMESELESFLEAGIISWLVGRRAKSLRVQGPK